ncbi:hypothetical protein [Mucilaginibacter kameinonensis]|uniref:hypothetical protein n=1 Tax=Mucilaginibacter kameinonensis TaxID=452286 RepID=UPI000EF83DA6|nr:hypothetical protein [Mucilaginibacter kameinonensis]
MKFNPVKSFLSKWLLTAILILGFFTFSGLNIQIANRFNKADTTLVAVSRNQSSRSISYKAALKVARRDSQLHSQFSNLQSLSLLHSREIDIDIKQLFILFMSNKPVKTLFFIRTYHSSADDGHSFIG